MVDKYGTMGMSHVPEYLWGCWAPGLRLAYAMVHLPAQKQAAAAMAGATKLPSEASAVVLEGGCFGLISDQESVIPIVTQEVSLRKRMGGHQTPLVVQNCDVVLVAIIHVIPHLQSFILL